MIDFKPSIWSRKDHELLEQWKQDYYNKTHTSVEESRDIKPDVDEVLLFGYSPITDLDYEIQQKIHTTLESDDYYKIKRKVGRKEKLRLPVPKKIKIQLVKQRGSVCQRCQEREYQEIHHIDSNPSNNSESNLLLVCYNCHKQIEVEIKRKRKGL